MNRAQPQIYEMHPMGLGMYWSVCAFALACGVTAIFVSARASDGRWVIASLGILFVIAGLSGFARPQTVVESDTRIVRRRFLLFGHWVLLSRRYSFSDFGAVVVLRVRRSSLGRDPDQFFVSLRRRSGRQILVRYFEAGIAGRCPQAEDLARRLSGVLQIEVDQRNS